MLMIGALVALVVILGTAVYLKLRQSGLLRDDSEERFAAAMAATGALALAGKLDYSTRAATSPVRIAVPRSEKPELTAELREAWAARLRERGVEGAQVSPADLPGALLLVAGTLRLEVQRAVRGRVAATPPPEVEGEDLEAYLAAPVVLTVARVQGGATPRARIRFAAEVLLTLLEDPASLGALEVQSGAYHPKRSLATLLELGDADGLAERLGLGAPDEADADLGG